MKLKPSSKAWMHEHINDEFVKRAQKEGYRARAAYKLTEIDDKDKLIKPGMTIVDLGSTPGSWSQVAVQRLKGQGRIIALDLLEMEPIKGVEFIQGDEKSPKLNKNSLDLVLVLDVYHHFDYPAEMLGAIRSALKSGGRLAICEYYKRIGAMGDPTSDRAVKHIRLDEADAIREIESSGFKLLQSSEFNPKSQYLAIFVKK